LLAPAPIIRHVDGMWPSDLTLHNHPPEHGKLHGKGRESTLGMFSCRLQTKRLVSGHWHDGILFLHLHMWRQVL
jgi:hypothetical protein